MGEKILTIFWKYNSVFAEVLFLYVGDFRAAKTSISMNKILIWNTSTYIVYVYRKLTSVQNNTLINK